MKKHRTILLLGILVALVFFYFGLNTWMNSQKEEKFVPPPVVKKDIVKPQPKPQTQPQQVAKQEKPSPAENQAQKKEESKNLQAKKVPQPPKEEKPISKKEPKKVEKPKMAKPKKAVAKLPKKQAKKPQVKAKEGTKSLKSFIVQIGAYTKKANASRALKKAKAMGYRAFIVEEDNFYKVRVKLTTSNLKTHLAKLRTKFPGAYRIR